MPGDVVDHFEAFLTDWEARAGDGPDFHWTGEVDVDVLRSVAAHWVRVANLVRERPDLGLLRPPAEADAFYDALIEAITDVLVRADDPSYTASFSSVVPDFDTATPTATASPSPHRVVLVDDTADIRTLLRIGFDLHPAFEVVGEAGDGRQAIEVCRTEQPDLVILDLRMPVMDGLAALPLLREACPAVRVILFSADASPADCERAVELGADECLCKSHAIPELPEVALRVLGAA